MAAAVASAAVDTAAAVGPGPAWRSNEQQRSTGSPELRLKRPTGDDEVRATDACGCGGLAENVYLDAAFNDELSPISWLCCLTQQD